MNAQIEHVLEQFRGAWRFRWVAILAAWLVCAIGWGLVSALPDWYEASARLFVDTRTALKPVLQGLAVQEDANQQLNYVRQSLLGAPQLEKVARETGLLTPAETDVTRVRKAVDDMRGRMNVRIQSANEQEGAESAGSVYSLTYRDRDRDRSIKIVQALFAALVDDTHSGKRQNSIDAQRFLEAQLKDYESRLRLAEDRLAEFKKHNLGMMPSDQGGYFARLQSEMDAVKTTDSALAVAASRREELARQLRGESAITASASSATVSSTTSGVAGGGDTASRVREAQARLDELLLKFTDRHPDVIAARESLKELIRRRDAEVESLRKGDPTAAVSSGVGANPVYQSIQLGLNQADVEIATIRRQLADHKAKVSELKRSLDTMPQVEAEYARLNRDYDVNKAQYNGLLVQLEKAKLGEQADTSGPAKFKIIEPPTAGFQPVAPQRFLLILAILVVSIGIGGGIAYALNLLRPVVWSAGSVAQLSKAEILGYIGSAFPSHLRKTSRTDLILTCVAAFGLVLVGVIVMQLTQAGARLAIPGIG